MITLPSNFDFSAFSSEVLGFCAVVIPFIAAFSAYAVVKKIIKGL